jgi:Citrate transporter
MIATEPSTVVPLALTKANEIAMEISPNTMIWTIAALSTGGVILQPFKLPEAIWAVGGAALLLALQLIAPEEALSGAVKGIDVYLFLTGMMLLAEIAREEGLFDWLAAVATSKAKGSPSRLFLLTYGVGALVTIFLSNDATAVVLTPAVAAAVKTAEADNPLPYLLICAFVANAASFVLPISNPANLVIYGHHMPPLLEWLKAYLLPATASIVATHVVLRWTQRNALTQRLAGCAGTQAFAGRQNGSVRHRRDGHCSPRLVRHGHSAWTPYRSVGCCDDCTGADCRTKGAPEYHHGRFLERVASRHWAIRACRGARQVGPHTNDYRASSRRGRAVGDLGRLGRRHDPRDRL